MVTSTSQQDVETEEQAEEVIAAWLEKSPEQQRRDYESLRSRHAGDIREQKNLQLGYGFGSATFTEQDRERLQWLDRRTALDGLVLEGLEERM